MAILSKFSLLQLLQSVLLEVIGDSVHDVGVAVVQWGAVLRVGELGVHIVVELFAPTTGDTFEAEQN